MGWLKKQRLCSVTGCKRRRVELWDEEGMFVSDWCADHEMDYDMFRPMWRSWG